MISPSSVILLGADIKRVCVFLVLENLLLRRREESVEIEG